MNLLLAIFESSKPEPGRNDAHLPHAYSYVMDLENTYLDHVYKNTDMNMIVIGSKPQEPRQGQDKVHWGRDA